MERLKSADPIRITSDDPRKTVELGIRIGRRLTEGMVVSLVGALGKGKTTLAKGIALGLGIQEEVTSPSFTIMSAYEGPITLYHIDLYRIDDPDELEYLGFDELFTEGGVCVIEWGEKAKGITPEGVITVEFRLLSGGLREISVSGLEL
jgi:tRNA threonylcarbamoyladenosine biosynthesis protein TsaE